MPDQRQIIVTNADHWPRHVLAQCGAPRATDPQCRVLVSRLEPCCPVMVDCGCIWYTISNISVIKWDACSFWFWELLNSCCEHYACAVVHRWWIDELCFGIDGFILNDKYVFVARGLNLNGRIFDMRKVKRGINIITYCIFSTPTFSPRNLFCFCSLICRH